MSIPIVFIHYGDCQYLDYTFRMAKKFNPGTDIYLIGGNINNRHSQYGIIHDQYSNYQYGDLWDEFIDNFKCISTFKDKTKFIFAFYRWFILHNFMREKQIERCWLFDSDTLICSDLSQKIERFSSFSLSLANHISCCTCLINDQSVTEKYIRLVIKLYQDENFLNNQRRIVADCMANGARYSLCVMTIFREYQKWYGPCGETSDIIDGESFDPNINLDRVDQIEVNPVWEMDEIILGSKQPIKKLYFIKNLPYCYHLDRQRMIRMNTLNMSWIPISYIKQVFMEIMNNV